MAKSTGFSFIWALLLGIVGASLFWLYNPLLQQEVSRQVEETIKKQEASAGGGEKVEVGKAATAKIQGSRFMMLAEGGRTFMADLKEGRIWRYFHHTREEGWARDEEGFAPLQIHFDGKKYTSAVEIVSAPEKE